MGLARLPIEFDPNSGYTMAMSNPMGEIRKWGKAHTLKFSFSRATEHGTREWTFSVTAFGLLVPLAVVLVLFVLATRPARPPAGVETVPAMELSLAPPEPAPGLSREARKAAGGSKDLIVPLNVRDPTALVMAPRPSRERPCDYKCPPCKKPRPPPP